MRKIFVATVALAALAMSISSAHAAINIYVARIQNGQVFIAGDQAPTRTAVFWEGVAVGKNTTIFGAFIFNTTNLPFDCVGRLTIGTEERDVVINNCTADITVIEAGVPKTGQLISHATGDDGDFQKGVTWPAPRFTKNVNAADDTGAGGGIASNAICDGTETCNGTITDHLTGLIWLQNANCFGGQTWANALTSANTLNSGECGLTDGSVEGDWRLPNVRELFSLVSFSSDVIPGPIPDPFLPAGHPFTNFVAGKYWSSTTVFSDASPWQVDFDAGGSDIVSRSSKTSNLLVTAVRGGS